MKIQFKICAIVLATTILSSCATKQGAGTAIGAVAGGLLGSQFGKGSGQLLAMGVGALAGGAIGNSIGKSLDEHDKMMLANSSHQALEYTPVGSSAEWRNPDSGNHGYVTPTKTYKSGSGVYCREYTQVIFVGGQEEKAYGKACRQQDGQWQIMQ